MITKLFLDVKLWEWFRGPQPLQHLTRANEASQSSVGGKKRGKKKWSSDLISLHSGRSKTSPVSWRLTWWLHTRPQRLLPPASSSLCLCFNLPTFSCISCPGAALPWHDIVAGKHLQAVSTLLEEQNEQRNKSQTTKCNCYFKPFHFLAVLFALAVTVAITVKDG